MGATALRARAGELAHALADRLATGSPDLDGAPTLLFAELAHQDSRYAETVRVYLDEAEERLADVPTNGLFDGAGAVAFAARATSRSPEDYAQLLSHIDRRVTARANALVVAEHERTNARRAGVDPATYDVTRGLTGLGAYLLTARRHSLADVLTALVALTDPVTVAGHRLPGWWVPDGTGRANGHLALGMAHGIAGPLALLTLAWRAGVRVTDQEQAIRRIASWLAAAVRDGGAGRYWPSTVPTGESHGTTDDCEHTWCTGTPGIARALQLAGATFDIPSWTRLAVAAVAGTVDRVLATAGHSDASLGHGWAGALHVTWRLAEDTGDERLIAGTHRLAERLLATLDTDPPDSPELLSGATGIALALHTYARDAAPASGWDRALLVA